MRQVSGSADWLLGRKQRSATDGILSPTALAVRNSVIPELIAALEDPCHHLRQSAVLALGKTGEPDVVPKILEMLADEHPAVSEIAVMSIGIFGSPDGIPVLVDLLEDNSRGRNLVRHAQGVPFRSRALAAIGLGWIGEASAVPALIRAADPSNAGAHLDVPAAAITGLGLMGSGASGAVDSLTRIIASTRAPDLLRSRAVVSLGKTGVREALAIVEKATRDSSLAVRRSAMLALGLLAGAEDKRALSILCNEVRKGSDPLSRNWACISLGRIGGPVAHKVLKEAVVDGSGSVRSFGALGLAILGRGAGDDGIGKYLRRGLAHSKQESTRGAFVVALGILGDRTAESELIRMLASNASPSLRGYAAISLGMMRSRAALTPIRELLAESRFDPFLQESAAVGLGLLGDREAAKILTRKIKPDESDTIQGAAAQSMGLVGDVDCIDTLLGMIADPKKKLHGARADAAAALGAIADRRSLPLLPSVSVDDNYRATFESIVFLWTLW